jgi:hypothetical protein
MGITTSKVRRIIFLLIFSATCLFADNVYLKNGYVYKNVIVIDTLENNVRVQFGNLRQLIPIADVETVLKLPLIPKSEPIYMEEHHQRANIDMSDKSTYYPNLKLLPIVVLASAIAWNSLATASDAQNSIDANNAIAKALKIPVDNSGLESTKSRNQIIGYVSLVTACMTLGLCFSDSQVEVSKNKLSMAIKF